MDKSTTYTRRDVCISLAKAAITIGLGNSLINASVYDNLETYSEEISIDLTLAENNALTKPNGAQYVKIAAEDMPLIVVRNTETKVSAYLSRCTHKGGKIGLPVNKTCTCELHGAQFDDEGNVKKGPATENLKKYYARLESNKIIITKSASAINTSSVPHSQQGLTFRQDTHEIIVHSINPRHYYSAQIINSSGKTVLKQGGPVTQPISTQGLAAGNYCLLLMLGNTIYKRNFSIFR